MCLGITGSNPFFFPSLCDVQDEVDPKRQKTENGSSA